MVTSPRAPTTKPRILSAARHKLQLAVGSLLVLGAGTWVGPRERPASPPPQERPAPLIQELTRREPDDIFRRVMEAGRAALPYAVSLPLPDAPAPRTLSDKLAQPAEHGLSGFGLLVSDEGEVLTHIEALDSRSTREVQLEDGTMIPARTETYDRATGLVLLRASVPDRAVPAPVSTDPPEAEALIVAAARRPDGDLVAPVLLTSPLAADGSLTFAGGPLLPGTPLFTMDGKALAIAGGNGRAAGYSVVAGLLRLRNRSTPGHAVPSSIGVYLQPWTEPLTQMLGGEGALVSDVLSGSGAARAGVKPGDRLVRIGEHDVQRPDDALEAIAALPPDQPATITVGRASRRVELSVVPSPAWTIGPTARARTSGAPLAADVLPESTLAARPVPGDAIVLAVGGRRVSSAVQARRALARLRGPRLLYLQHGGRRFYLVIDAPQKP